MPLINDINKSDVSVTFSADEQAALRNHLHAMACAVVDEVMQDKLSGSPSVENAVHQDYYINNQITNNLLTVKDVAGILKLSVRKIWRLVAEGKLPAPVKIGRSSRWLASEVDAYLQTVISNRKNQI